MKTTLTLLLTVLSYLAYSQVPTSGLVAYYKFSGNANDSSGNSNHGTVNNVTLTSDRFGNANKAYSFNGINSYISIPHHAMFNFSNYSISTWIKYNGPGPAGTVFWSILSKNNTAGGNFDPFHILLVNATKNSGGRIGSGTTHIEFSPSPPLNDGGWHQITIVFNNNSNIITHYVDGVFLQSNTFTANPVTNTSPINIGRWAGYNNYFNGAIDDIRFYDRALSNQEVSNLYQSENPINNYSFMTVKCFIEGYYSGSNTMTNVLNNSGYQTLASNYCDSILVDLIGTTGIQSKRYTYSTVLQTNGQIQVGFPTTLPTGQYHIVLRHRNALRTTYYYTPIAAGNFINFSNASILYQRFISPGVYALFSGDLNKDLNIDLVDGSILEADLINYISGYTPTDLNGDGNVDLLDSSIMELNINEFVGNPD